MYDAVRKELGVCFERQAESKERPVMFMCPQCFERGAWPLDPDCSTCAGSGVVGRERFDGYLAAVVGE